MAAKNVQKLGYRNILKCGVVKLPDVASNTKAFHILMQQNDTWA